MTSTLRYFLALLAQHRGWTERRHSRSRRSCALKIMTYGNLKRLLLSLSAAGRSLVYDSQQASPRLRISRICRCFHSLLEAAIAL